MLTSRHPECLDAVVATLGSRVVAAEPAVATQADVIVLAVPWPNAAAALSELPSLAGKILVDAANPFASPLTLADLGDKTRARSWPASPRGRLVKPFNSITMARFMAGPGAKTHNACC